MLADMQLAVDQEYVAYIKIHEAEGIVSPFFSGSKSFSRINGAIVSNSLTTTSRDLPGLPFISI
jgi:hypothetical protein